MTVFSDHGSRLHMAVHTDGDRTTLALTGELDRFSGQPLVPLLDAVMDGSVKHLDVQMAQVDFVDVYGVRVLVHAYQLGAVRGVKLTVHDPQPNTVWLLHITGAAQLLGESPAPADTAMLYLAYPPAPVPPAGSTNERDRHADERDRHADERDRHADEREEQADDRDRLAQERDRLIDEREQRVAEHQRWEDIREDVANARERDLERREREC